MKFLLPEDRMDVTIYSLEGVRSAVSELLHATERCYTLTEEKKYYIRLLLNETITNAFCHSGQSCAMLDWTIRKGVLVFSVEDRGRGFERRNVPEPELESDSGRGLLIVESIADRVVYEKGGRKILVEMAL